MQQPLSPPVTVRKHGSPLVAVGFALAWAVLLLALVSSWVLIGDSDRGFRSWSAATVPLLTLQLFHRSRAGQRFNLAAFVPVVFVWAGLLWLTTCSYADYGPGEECYLTRAQALGGILASIADGAFRVFPALLSLSGLALAYRDARQWAASA